LAFKTFKQPKKVNEIIEIYQTANNVFIDTTKSKLWMNDYLVSWIN